MSKAAPILALLAIGARLNAELSPSTGRTPVRAFRTKAEAIARIQKCLSEMEQAPGFRRMRERLGEDGAEILRRQVLADQAVARSTDCQHVGVRMRGG